MITTFPLFTFPLFTSPLHMTITQKTNALEREMRRTLARCLDELDLPYAIVIGVLECLKAEIVLECIHDDDDDDSGDDWKKERVPA